MPLRNRGEGTPTTRQTDPSAACQQNTLFRDRRDAGAAGMSGCTSTSQMKAAPALAETATAAGADAGFTIPLPETVSVPPQSSGIAPVQTTELTPGPATPALDPAVQPLAATAAFAGSTPAAPAVPAIMTANAWQAPPPATAGEPVKTAETIRPPGWSCRRPPRATGSRATGRLCRAANRLPCPVPNGTGGRRARDGRARRCRAADRPICRASTRCRSSWCAASSTARATFNPRAYNNGHWGLMQIKHATARGMGYGGPARGPARRRDQPQSTRSNICAAPGWRPAATHDRADRLLRRRGYYYDAKRKGLLDGDGLGHDRQRRRLQPDA